MAEHVLPRFCAYSFHGNSMNNLLSYCGLIDAKIRASAKDLPVPICRNQIYQITGQNCRQLIIIESNLNQTISSKLVSMFICCSSILTCNFNHWAITNCRFQTGNVWPQCWFLSYLWWSCSGWQGCHNVNSFICLKNSF